jgi:hypothetical protein
LDSDFECRLRVLFGESLYTVARVAGDQCPFGDGLDSEPVKKKGSKPEEISRQVDIHKLPAPVGTHQIFAGCPRNDTVPGVGTLFLDVNILLAAEAAKVGQGPEPCRLCRQHFW